MTPAIAFPDDCVSADQRLTYARRLHAAVKAEFNAAGGAYRAGGITEEQFLAAQRRMIRRFKRLGEMEGPLKAAVGLPRNDAEAELSRLRREADLVDARWTPQAREVD